MGSMVGTAERADCSIHTIQTVHITLSLVWISMQLALCKEPWIQQWFQPRWPFAIFFIASLHRSNTNRDSRRRRKRRKQSTYQHWNKHTYQHLSAVEFDLFDKVWVLFHPKVDLWFSFFGGKGKKWKQRKMEGHWFVLIRRLKGTHKHDTRSPNQTPRLNLWNRVAIFIIHAATVCLYYELSI